MEKQCDGRTVGGYGSLLILVTWVKLGDILHDFERVIVHLSSDLASFGQIKIIFSVFHTSVILKKGKTVFRITQTESKCHRIFASLNISLKLL